MGLKIAHAPVWLQHPLVLALRTLASPALVMPIDVASRVARSALRSFATSRLNRKKFPRAIANLKDAYPEWDDDKVHATAVAAYEHLGQLAVELLHTPRLITEEGYARHLSLADLRQGAMHLIEGRPCIMITGHVGNWELIGYSVSMLGYPMSAVYRPLDLKPLDAWMRETRSRQGLSLVSKRGALRELPASLERGMPVGLVADQNGGDRGLFVPFFDRLTSTYKSIGHLAIRHNAMVICGFARRLDPSEPDPIPQEFGEPAACRLGPSSMRYSAEIVDTFGPDDWSTHPDPLFYLTARYRRAMETMVRRSPEQYLWMHRIWRSRPPHERSGKPFPAGVEEKLRALPWMTDDDVERVKERSRRDMLTPG
ncbi:MAG: lysophospholipid acyltransferase family protein [Phycisphaerales bacterium]|nr:MAG: lysophospholipid acyltransferase family protein [Phycisphaerales bacterium]